ncbi:MAG: WYL domain-containing protein [Chloroflexi bacterium]|nr:MAG: WYL domain-containing protein [Chloroflexota bacterium]
MPEETSYQRGDKFLRVITLFDSLQTTERGKSTQELADELGVDVRSVQRYIAQLQDAGLDIERDAHSRYKVGEGSRLPSMQFSKAEGVDILIALRLLQQLRSTRDDALIGAVARLANAMKIGTVTSYLGTMLQAAEAKPESPRQRIENVVVQCFVDRIPCEIDYENVDGEVNTRVIRSYFLEPRVESHTVFVFALDSKSRSTRWFRMDRIHSARELRIEGTYAVPEDFDIGAMTGSSWGVWQPGEELQSVVLRFHPAVAARVRQSTWHPSAVLTDLPDGGVEMRLRVASEVEMRPWVLGWGAQVEVLEPPSLREHATASMREGARMYGKGTPAS